MLLDLTDKQRRSYTDKSPWNYVLVIRWLYKMCVRVFLCRLQTMGSVWGLTKFDRDWPEALRQGVSVYCMSACSRHRGNGQNHSLTSEGKHMTPILETDYFPVGSFTHKCPSIRPWVWPWHQNITVYMKRAQTSSRALQSANSIQPNLIYIKK